MREELLKQAGSSQSSSATIADELAALEGRLARTSTAVPEIGRSGPRETVDRNADGRPDLWVYLEPDGARREVLDENYDGRPDRIRTYNRARKLARVEEDLDGNGEMETISLFEGGEIVRKRADENGDGVTDSWSFYEAGQLVRHEVDRNSDGFRDLLLLYAKGQLVREEEDGNGDGRPDIVTHYRDGEIHERHEDLDFDGKADIKLFYERGKLIRREVHSDSSLEPTPQDTGS